jgi:hypothetical protein
MSALHLHPLHLADLRASNLTDETIQTMGLKSVRPADISKLASGGLPDVESALEFPYARLNGNDPFSRYKLFPPQTKDGHTMKYFQQADSGCRLYLLDPILRILPDPRTPLMIVEGEKKTALAVQSGRMAVGVSGVWAWSENGQAIPDFDHIAWVDREVDIVFDSDTWTRDDLQRALFALGKEIEGRGAKVTAPVIPGERDKKIGFDDFVVAHGMDAFEKLTRVPLKHPTLKRHLEWWQTREKKRKTPGLDSLQGQALNLSDPELWPDTVDGAKLLDDIAVTFRRFVVLPPHADVVEALWCVHAHALDAFGISPVLEINSPELECGKSVNQSVMRRMAPRGLTTTSISMSSIFRTVEKFKPTLFVDEGDAFLSLNEDLRGILNSSHLRNDAFVIRTEGDEHEPRAFSTWCAKSIALIGNLPPTLRSRAITVQMKRKTGQDKVEDFHGHHPYPELEVLKKQAWRWTHDNLSTIRDARPSMPDGLINRTKDNWSPLFAIAEVAGGGWPKKCMDAAWAFQKGKPDETSIGVMLLSDIQDLFRESEGEPLPTEEILNELSKLDERPWSEWKKGKPITAVQLARLLKPFGIRPTTIRIGDKTPKGYNIEDCVDAFRRYIPPPTDSEPQHPQQTYNFNDLDPVSEAQQKGMLRIKKTA